MKKIFITSCCVFASIFLLLATFSTKAADLDTTNPYFEINHVMGNMANANHISFNTVYYMETFDSTGLTRDTMRGSYKINAEKFYATLDSTVIVQNDFYNMSLSKLDSSIIVASTKILFPLVAQTDIFNSTFQSAYLSNIIVSDSANTRKLSFVFNANSPYSAYDFVFDTATYNLNYIRFAQRNYSVPGMQNTYYTQMKVVFSNYQYNTFTDSVFDTSVYFTRVNGVFVATPPYSLFTIYNQVMNQ